MDILYTCQHCHEESTSTISGSEIEHGAQYHLTCSCCGKESELMLAIYPLNEPER